ncbi:MAG: hypothetical protein JWN30_1841 [Bacilli bacterium]|nr:hypothetical protein [Bacilli bacterium]
MKIKLGLLILVMTLAFAGVTHARYDLTGILSLSNDKHPPVASGSTNTQSADLAQTAQLDVPSQAQDPELYNGCEVTSLSMLLSAAGHPVPKTVLADEVLKDPAPEEEDAAGDPVSWGNPNRGFVGDITGENPGYGVYHAPIASLVNEFMSGQANDLTGSSFDAVLQQVAAGKPVVVWTTVGFEPTTSWVTWQSPTGPVHATLEEHCVLLVGYDAGHVMINDPLDGTKDKAVDRDPFIAAWKQLGQQAITYK